MRCVFYITILSLLFGACSIQKRHYRKGYYLAGHHHKRSAAFVDKSPKVKPLDLTALDKQVVNLAIVASVQRKNDLSYKKIIYLNQKFKPLKVKTDSCGDIIYLRNGKEITAKISEITVEEIKYKRCDNLEGPQYTISKGEVHSIKFINGVTETFEKPFKNVKQQLSSANNLQKEIHPMAYLVLALTACVFIGSIFAIIAALVVAPIAKRKILQEPDKYKGLELIRTCQIIGSVILVFAALFIVLIILAMI
jgi:hypothetical protein